CWPVWRACSSTRYTPARPWTDCWMVLVCSASLTARCCFCTPAVPLRCSPITLQYSTDLPHSLECAMNLTLFRDFFLVLLLTASFVGQASAGELLKQIQANGQIRVGLEGTYPPFSFQDANGQLDGFEVEFARALAKELGVEAQLQPTKWDGILAALESKRLDVVINQVTISEERKQKYDFSTPYTVSGVQALV